MGWITEAIEQFHYLAVAFVIFIAGLGAPIPEDIPLIYGGVMSGRGVMNVYVHFAVCMVFIMIGDLCLYGIGRRISENASRPSRWQRLLTPERKARVEAMFERYGGGAVFFGRFVAGVRGAVFLTAGMARYPLGRFLVLDFLAACISVPVWIGIGYWASTNWEAIAATAQRTQLIALLTLALIVAAVFLIRRRRARDAAPPAQPPGSPDSGGAV